jgi:3-hydroxybutyryl-CoA dehydrogenase
MEISTVGVIGAGTMGNGIAHVFAKVGYRVILLDVEQRFVDRGLQTISKNLEREVAKSKLTSEQRDLSLARITGTTDRKQIADCQFVVEEALDEVFNW